MSKNEKRWNKRCKRLSSSKGLRYCLKMCPYHMTFLFKRLKFFMHMRKEVWLGTPLIYIYVVFFSVCPSQAKSRKLTNNSKWSIPHETSHRWECEIQESNHPRVVTGNGEGPVRSGQKLLTGRSEFFLSFCMLFFKKLVIKSFFANHISFTDAEDYFCERTCIRLIC